MKRFLHFILIVGLLSGCVDAEIDEARQSLSSVMPNVINISLDDDTTRVQLNASGKTVWTEDDCVSAFYMSDANNKFRFNGETGDRDGKFIIESMGTATTDIDNIVLLYPYSSSYKLNAAKSQIDVYIPSTQYYEAGSYGVGANIMASVETDDDFTLKSLCGWIVVQLKGDATITNITLSGNNGEQLAGDADFDYADFNLNLVYYPNGSNIYGDSNVGGSLVWGDCLESITLDCGDGIALNPDKPTEFYFVVPPQKFTKGITIEAECLRGEPIVKSSSKALTVQRNHIVPMSTITANEVIPNNQIWYTSSDGEVVEPDDDTAFGATLLSNTYVNGIGVITFNGEVTTIGECAFSYCESLTSITIPDSVTAIGYCAFYGCDNLTEITIPESVTTIGYNAFDSCKNLTNVTIGNGVVSIGEDAFDNCSSLTSVTIPDSVTTIGSHAFGHCTSLANVTLGNGITSINDAVFCSCTSLTGITIPDSVITIVHHAFEGCTSLTSVTIPDSVTEIGDNAFDGCSNLTSVTIGDCVTTIGWGTFYNCASLKSIIIPDSVTTIENYAFYDCASLTSVYCKATTPPTAFYEDEDWQDWDAFGDNAQNRKIYVPAEAVDAYKSAKGWSDYADYIIGYDFENNIPISGLLTLSIDKSVVFVGDVVKFIVMQEGVDVTAYSTIYNSETYEKVDGALFVADIDGSYSFYAVKGSVISRIFNFNVIVPTPELPEDTEIFNTKFDHRILLVHHTGTGNAFGPLMVDVLRELSNNDNYQNKYYEAVCHTYSSYSPLCSDSAEFISDLYGINAYPALCTNLYPQEVLYYNSDIMSEIDSMLQIDGADVGISASANMGSTMITIRAGVKANITGDYRITAWLLEDNIYAQQSGTDDESYYIHNNVVRNIASTEHITGFGLGTLETGETAIHDITLDISDTEWNKENLKILVIATGLNDLGYYEVVNIAMCPVNGSVGYEYM